MSSVKVQGIVVGETLFKESSKILKVFTRDLGIISLMSRGCRNIKSALHEGSNKLIFADFTINYKENSISTLTSIDILDNFKNIVMDYHDIDKKMYSFYIVDLAIQVINDKKISNEDDNGIYDLVISSVKKINEGFNPIILYDIVRLKLLDDLGVKPSLDGCSVCGSSNIFTLSSNNFGYICKDCYEEGKIVKEDTIKYIRMLYYVDVDRIKKLDIDEIVLKEIEEFLDDYYLDNTGIFLKSNKNKKVLDRVKSMIES